jgi:hypothetical protein
MRINTGCAADGRTPNRGPPTRTRFLKNHGWQEYASWHLALTEGAADETKARYAFVFGDFHRLHRMGLIACYYRAAEWEHTEVMIAAHRPAPPPRQLSTLTNRWVPPALCMHCI